MVVVELMLGELREGGILCEEFLKTSGGGLDSTSETENYKSSLAMREI